MAPTASWAATQTELPIRMSLHPTFWDQLNAEQRISCRRNENPVTIDGRPGYDVCGILEEKWKHMFPAIQAHLNSPAAKIFKTHQGRQIEYAVWPYIIGTLTDFRPYVVASCLYLDIAKRVLKVIHEKLNSFTPRPGFGYLAINCPITLPMKPTQPEKTGAWNNDGNGNMYRILVIKGSPYIQYSHEMALVRPYRVTSSPENPRVTSFDNSLMARTYPPPPSFSTTPQYESHNSLDRSIPYGKGDFEQHRSRIERPQSRTEQPQSPAEQQESRIEQQRPRIIEQQRPRIEPMRHGQRRADLVPPKQENVLVPPFTLFPREDVDRRAYTESANRRSSMVPVEPVLAPAPRNMCGMAINIKCRKDNYETVGTATIGGCLCIDSKYYGFTVAHALAAGFQSHSNPMSRSAGPTSESWEADAELSDLSESDDELDASTAKLESLRLKPGMNEFSWKPQSDLGPWQKVSKASIILGDDLDWLIFPLGNDIDRFENVVTFDQNRLVPEVVYPKEVEGELPDDIEPITLVTGVSGKKQVRPSSTLCGIFIPSAGHVVKVWSIRSGSYVARPGDSGSWAIGEGGEVYGYLVGICEQLGAGYVAPMSTAMAAICAKTNTSEVTIPGRSAGTGARISSRTQSTRQQRSQRGWFVRGRHDSKSGPPTELDQQKLDIKGTDGDRESLDGTYRKRPNSNDFFKRGKVFFFLWHQNAYSDGPEFELSEAISVTRGAFQQEIHSSILRMVVVKEAHGYCWCLMISTYGEQGVLKSGLSAEDRNNHTAIYMTGDEPTDLPDIGWMDKEFIAVDPASPDQKLHKMSRLDFRRVYSVEHNVKVKEIGRVSRKSMPYLESYWRAVVNEP